MLPLIPYDGFLRPLLVLFATGTTLVLLRRTYRKPCFPAALWAVCAGYIFLLLYATLLSRTPSDARMYRLEPLASLKGAFEMAEGTGLRLQAPQALEGIFLNLCLCVPVGYLLPLAFLQRGKQMRFWQVICAGAAVSASTVHRGQRAFARIPREQLAVQQTAQRCAHGVEQPVVQFPLSAETRAMLNLLACEQFGQEMEIDASKVDWHRVLAEANRHVLTAFLYPGLRRLNGVPEEILSRARNAAMLSAARMEESLRAQDGILDLMRSHEIPCAVLKGFSAACRYPHPELRVPGDIDILVLPSHLSAACAEMEGVGFKKELSLEKHECLSRANTWVEVHQMVTAFPESEKGNYAREFMNGALSHTQDMEIQGIRFPILDGIYQMIGLLAHKEQHLATSGIGLRQICDWAVTVHALREQIGEKEIATLERCGLLHFAKVVTRLCEKYLGLPPCPWCQNAMDDQVDALMEDILSAGNFHEQYGKRPFTGVLTDAYGSGKSSVLRNYFHYIRKRIDQDYPWAKNPLWIPAFGLFFPMRYCARVLIGKRKKINVSQAVHTAQRREKMLRSLKLYQ